MQSSGQVAQPRTNYRTVAAWMQQSIGTTRPAHVPTIPEWSRILVMNDKSAYSYLTDLFLTTGVVQAPESDDGQVQGIDWGCQEDPGNATARGEDKSRRGSFSGHPTRIYSEFPVKNSPQNLAPATQPSNGAAASSAALEVPASESALQHGIEPHTPPPSGPGSPHSTRQNGSGKAKSHVTTMSGHAPHSQRGFLTIPEQSHAKQDAPASSRGRQRQLSRICYIAASRPCSRCYHLRSSLAS